MKNNELIITTSEGEKSYLIDYTFYVEQTGHDYVCIYEEGKEEEINILRYDEEKNMVYVIEDDNEWEIVIAEAEKINNELETEGENNES